jgi:acyl-coenzyme A thioesterase PaaI-like protein
VTDQADTYPPPQHVLRDLALSVQPTAKGRAEARMVLTPALRRAGEPVPGVLTTVIDALGGHLALYAVAPDWMATSALTLHRWGTPTGTITFEGTVLRQGRTNLVIEVGAADDRGPFGASTMSFAILPRRPGTPTVDLTGAPQGLVTAPGDDAAVSSLSDAIGYVVDPDGSGASLAVEPYVRNSFGALNGGVLAGLIEMAATGAEGGVVRQFTVHYLRQATAGPVAARRRPLGPVGDLAAYRVDVADRGADDRHCAVATVLVDRSP